MLYLHSRWMGRASHHQAHHCSQPFFPFPHQVRAQIRKYKYKSTNKNDWMPHQTGQHSQAEKALNVEICLARDMILPQERSISDLGYKHAAIATALRFFGSKNKKNNCEKQCYFFLTMTFPPTARKQSCTKCYDQNGLHPMQWQAIRLISQYHTHPNRLGKNYSVPKWNSVF